MATFNESLERIRYYLRDTEGAIWSDESLLRLWNDMQVDVAISTGILERVEAYRWPPSFTFSYTHEWENTFAYGDRYQCMRYWSANSMTCCYSWEPAHWLSADPPADSGDQMTAPLEVAYGSAGDFVMCPLHTRCHRLIFAAFDKEVLQVTTEKELASKDGYYRLTSGEPTHLYFPDMFHNMFVLYPRPTNYQWDEWTESDTFSDTLSEGLVSWREGALDYSDYGMVAEDVSKENVVMIYQSIPYDISDDVSTWDDDLEWDGWMVRVLEAGVLSRAFGMDNDGFIPSLRDYWALRYSAGIEALKIYRRMRSHDVDWVIGSYPSRQRSYLRLGPHYPRED